MNSAVGVRSDFHTVARVPNHYVTKWPLCARLQGVLPWSDCVRWARTPAGRGAPACWAARPHLTGSQRPLLLTDEAGAQAQSGDLAASLQTWITYPQGELVSTSEGGGGSPGQCWAAPTRAEQEPGEGQELVAIPSSLTSRHAQLTSSFPHSPTFPLHPPPP